MLALYVAFSLIILLLFVIESLDVFGFASILHSDQISLLVLIPVAVLVFVLVKQLTGRKSKHHGAPTVAASLDTFVEGSHRQPGQGRSEVAVAVLPSDDEQRCKDVINNMADVAFQTDVNGRWIFLSPSWEKLTGFSIQNSLGHSFLDSVHPEESFRNEAQLRHFNTGHKQTCWYDTRLLTADSGSRWVEVRAKALLSESGVLEGLTGTITDIHKRKLTEESLRANGRALITMLDRLPGMLYRGRHDRDYTMEYVSEGCFELTGYEACDFVDNMKLAYVDLIHPEQRDYVWYEIQSALNQNRPFSIEYPIITQTGKRKWVWEQGRGVYSAGGELLALEGAIFDISARKEAEETARHESSIDALTGLCNYATFEQRLEYVLEHSRSVGYPVLLIYLDLDDFKELVQRFGERTGVLVIGEIGHRLMAIQRRANTAGWMGSDKFAILISDLSDPLLQGGDCQVPWVNAQLEDTSLTLRALQITKQIQQEISQPFRINDTDLVVTASAGIAVNVSEYENAQRILQAAIDAAHRAKFLGPSHATLADSALYTRGLKRSSSVDSSLAGAFSEKKLRVYYQPIVSLYSRSVFWVEAVMYWHHPRRGLLEFNSDLSMIENNELLVSIGHWLFSEVCRQKQVWHSELADRCPEAVCVNLPAACLVDETLVHQLNHTLAASRLTPGHFILGVWQGAADIGDPTSSLNQLSSMGVRLVGDAMTEMARADNSPCRAAVWRVDLVKLQQKHGLAFLGEISAKAKASGAIGIVTGIKNEEAMAMAQFYGFHYGVGSLFCEPVSFERINQILRGPHGYDQLVV